MNFKRLFTTLTCLTMLGTVMAQTNRQVLRDGWSVTEGTHTYQCTLPTTAMGVLTANGEYTDVLEKLNYKNIDASRFDHPWTFTRQVSLPQLNKDQRVVLHLHGVDYRADVKWNGKLVASADTLYGPFRNFDIDLTDGAQANNRLEIVVSRAQNGDPNHGYVDWNVRPADESMGLLRDVTLTVADRAMITHTAVASTVNTKTLAEADLTVKAILTNVTDRELKGWLCGSYESGSFRVPVTLKPNERRAVCLDASQLPALHVERPRLWWCAGMGTPELYHMQLSFETGDEIVDQQSTSFGIRQIESNLDQWGHRIFSLNGKRVMVRGAGWVDDIFMRNTEEDYLKQMKMVLDMGLNTVRHENYWGTTDKAYSICDSLGLMVMVGLSCQWEWDAYLHAGVENEYSAIPDTPEMQQLITRTLHDETLNLRHHPSIICWMIGSDNRPYPTWEKGFLDAIRSVDDRPIQLSAADRTSELFGKSGVKMSGPYEYEGPAYYFDEDSFGGAFGFNTETSLGAQLPVRENVIRIVGKNNTWPIRGNETYNYHCTASTSAMNTLDVMSDVIRQRFGEAKTFDSYMQCANLIQMEGSQSLFEAFRANEPKATGTVHWMLNSAWPSLYWQLYDWYNTPTSAYYGTKRANNPVQLVYDFAHRKAIAVNATIQTVKGKASIEIYDLKSKQLLKTEHDISIAPSEPVVVESLDQINKDCVAFLSFEDANGNVAKAEYWIPADNDEYDHKKVNWYMTPIAHYASYKSLNALKAIPLKVAAKKNGNQIIVNVVNDSQSLAFFTELVLINAKGVPVPYSTMSDNYFSLRPGEQRVISVPVNCNCPKELVVRTWNTPEQRIKVK